MVVANAISKLTVGIWLGIVVSIFCIKDVKAVDEDLTKTININYPTDTSAGKTNGVAVAGAAYTFTVVGAPAGSCYEWTTSGVAGSWSGGGSSSSATFSPLGTSSSTSYSFTVKVFGCTGPGGGSPWTSSGSETLNNPVITFNQPTQNVNVCPNATSTVEVTVTNPGTSKTLAGVTVEFQRNPALGSFNPTSTTTASGGIATSLYTASTTAGDVVTLQAKCGPTTQNGPTVTVVDVTGVTATQGSSSAETNETLYVCKNSGTFSLSAAHTPAAASPPSTFKWTKNGVNFATTWNTTDVTTTEGTYTYTAKCCTTCTGYTVTVVVVKVVITTSNDCVRVAGYVNGATTATLTATLTPTISGVTYTWSKDTTGGPGDGTFNPSSSSTQNTTVFTPSTTGAPRKQGGNYGGGTSSPNFKAKCTVTKTGTSLNCSGTIDLKIYPPDDV